MRARLERVRQDLRVFCAHAWGSKSHRGHEAGADEARRWKRHWAWRRHQATESVCDIVVAIRSLACDTTRFS